MESVEYPGQELDYKKEAAKELFYLVPIVVTNCKRDDVDGKVGVDGVHHQHQGDVDEKVGTIAILDVQQHIVTEVKLENIVL